MLLRLLLIFLLASPVFGQGRWENEDGHPNRRKFDKPEKYLNWEIGKSEGSDSVWVKMFKWSGYMDETYFNALVAVNPDTLYYIGDTLFVETADDIRKVYEKPEGTEIEKILSKPPIEPRWTIPIRYSDNVDIAYQNKISEYTGVELADYLAGITHRPPRVENSYRLKHKFKGGINVDGDSVYQSSKIGHLYRPTAVDATGDTLWLDQLIVSYDWDIDGTVDLEWWGKATYPVTIGPIIGDNTFGASTVATSNYSLGYAYGYLNYTASVGDVADAGYVYMNVGGISGDVDICLYRIDLGATDDTITTQFGSEYRIDLTSTPGWRSVVMSESLEADTTYTVAIGVFNDGAGHTYHYDSHGSNIVSRDNDNTLPPAFQENSARQWEKGMYINVTSAGAAEASPRRRKLLTEGL